MLVSKMLLMSLVKILSLLRRRNGVLEPRNLLGVFDLRISSFIKKNRLGPIEIVEEAQFRAGARCTSFGRWTTSTMAVLTTLLFVVYQHFFIFTMYYLVSNLTL